LLKLLTIIGLADPVLLGAAYIINTFRSTFWFKLGRTVEKVVLKVQKNRLILITLSRLKTVNMYLFLGGTVRIDR
jgi:hypothetical protein